MKRPVQTSEQRQAEQLLGRLVRFCRRRGARIFRGFSPDVLREYLEFHCRHGTLRWNRHRGQIRALAVAWRCSEDEILAANEAGSHVFRWKPDAPAGDCLVIGEVVAIDRIGLVGLLLGFAGRFPGWQRLKIYTWRHERLARVAPATLIRLARFCAQT